MSYLAFDTSTAYTTVAISNGDGLILAKEKNTNLYAQAKILIPLLQKVMSKSKKTFSDLDAIYVVKGPGSFTGIRLGLAVAMGFKAASNIDSSHDKKIEIKSLSAFDAIAYALDLETRKKYSSFPLLIILDTKRDDFFVQPFSAYDADQMLRTPLFAPKCLSKEELEVLIKSKNNWVLTGHGLNHTCFLSMNIFQKYPSLTVLDSFSHATASRILLARKYLEKNNRLLNNLSPLYLRPAYVHEQQKKRMPNKHPLR